MIIDGKIPEPQKKSPKTMIMIEGESYKRYEKTDKKRIKMKDGSYKVYTYKRYYCVKNDKFDKYGKRTMKSEEYQEAALKRDDVLQIYDFCRNITTASKMTGVSIYFCRTFIKEAKLEGKFTPQGDGKATEITTI